MSGLGSARSAICKCHRRLSSPLSGNPAARHRRQRAILEELHARRAPLYAITNWSGEKFRETRPRYPFLDCFRDIVVSGDERIIKPGAAIYNLPVARHGLHAADCLFVDDNLHNVEGARAVGMQSHHLHRPRRSGHLSNGSCYVRKGC